MNFYSTNRQSPSAGFREATINGQAPDRGLYFPETIPQLPNGFTESLRNLSREEIALEVIRPYAGDAIPEPVLQQIVADTVGFEFPLVPVQPGISALELFHGPTLAFKDVGARFMSRCLGYFVQGRNQKVTVLVATSGDTGGAVASGFYGVEGVEVVILYPSGKVSSVQEQQLTTFGKNITALEVLGNFDDCQHLVKQAFSDRDIHSKMFLTSANSINVARWLPQQFYYFFAHRQWPGEKPPVVSVPSGNFGNICAGLLAHASGLPVEHFVAACNANDVVSSYLDTGDYQPRAAVPTISNAMDVGNPSNFVRILEIFGGQLQPLKQLMSSESVPDTVTRDTISQVYAHTGYLLDPHGAVAFHALSNYLREHPASGGYLLGTAHPVKFYDVVEPVINEKIAIPVPIQSLMSRHKQSIRMGVSYTELKDFLLSGR